MIPNDLRDPLQRRPSPLEDNRPHALAAAVVLSVLVFGFLALWLT
ncbi:hypothetical protein ACFQ14_10615 [Pseudahrensia aquimaris]|uniref:Uncharacterized protein n=1 Tax=Pseudahrensia aquimaris TaxID=744461 RepID=A0ABW3FJ53_9HYPH